MTSEYQVHLLPPPYPESCRPFTCRHEPQFVMSHAVHIRRVRSHNKVEIDHAVCLACGAPQPCTVGGNVLVDLHLLWRKFGAHPQIGSRIIQLRERWARIAPYLFDETGWRGRHERVARLIDPPLTMRLAVSPAANQAHDRMGTISFDLTLVRDAS